MKKGFANIVLIIIIVLVVGGAGYYFAKQGNKVEIPSEEQVGQNEQKEVSDIVSPSTTQSCAPGDTPSITVISPNGGEVFQVGGQMAVTWESCNLPTPWVVVSLRNGEGDTLLTDPETSDDGNEIFTLPLNLSSRNYQIRVGHAAANVQQDLSDNLFTIKQVVSINNTKTVCCKTWPLYPNPNYSYNLVQNGKCTPEVGQYGVPAMGVGYEIVSDSYCK